MDVLDLVSNLGIAREKAAVFVQEYGEAKVRAVAIRMTGGKFHSPSGYMAAKLEAEPKASEPQTVKRGHAWCKTHKTTVYTDGVHCLGPDGLSL
jgi:hypothetical protein